jgi:hypothetical protein
VPRLRPGAVVGGGWCGSLLQSCARRRLGELSWVGGPWALVEQLGGGGALAAAGAGLRGRSQSEARARWRCLAVVWGERGDVVGAWGGGERWSWRRTTEA